MEHRHRQRGVTLVELLTAVAILAILSGIAVPSLSSLVHGAQRRSAINDYWHAIYLARSEAIKRNSVVVMCKSRDGRRCDHLASNWADGWLVFENRDGDEPAVVDPNEPILRHYAAKPGMTISSNRPSFTFRPFVQGSINGTITFCDAEGERTARAIIISHTGRPRESDRDPNRRALHCSA